MDHHENQKHYLTLKLTCAEIQMYRVYVFIVSTDEISFLRISVAGIDLCNPATDLCNVRK